MKPWAELTAGARSVRVGGIAAVIIAILWGIWTQRGTPQTDDAADGAVALVDPTVGAAADNAAAVSTEPTAQSEAADGQTEATATAAATDATPDAPVPPKLDVVRVTRDGSAIIAGVGVPNARLSLRVDGVEVISVPADQNGNFVGMFNLPPSDAPRQLSIVMVMPDGTELSAAESIAIAPTSAPVAVADAGADATKADETALADQDPAALMVTPEGAKVLQGIGDADVTAANVTVDAITYTPEGAVQLAGRGTGGAGVRLYLDNAAVGEASVAKDGGWSVTLSDIAAGIYTLRADQIDASGKVTSRFETPFKRESLEALAAATGASADANSDATSADTGTTNTGTTDAGTAGTVGASQDATAGTGAVTAEDTASQTAADSAANTDDASSGSDVASAEPVDQTAESNATGDAAQAAGTDAAPATDGEGTDGADTATDATASAAADTAEVTDTADAAAVTADTVAEAPAAPVQVTVQPGYSLWRIARENLGDGILYVQVFEANKGQIRDPDLIYPGQVFTLPGGN